MSKCKTCGVDGYGFHSCFDVLVQGHPNSARLRELWIRTHTELADVRQEYHKLLDLYEMLSEHRPDIVASIYKAAGLA